MIEWTESGWVVVVEMREDVIELLSCVLDRIVELVFEYGVCYACLK